MTDYDYMNMALKLARRGEGKTNPNPAVGCVIVKNGRIVGEGWHKKCGGAHAEIFALRRAGVLAKGAVMYVTLEPCSFYGRTPPCADAVIASSVKRVVIAVKDPHPKVCGRSIQKMRRAGIDVTVGCLRQDASALNRAFFKWSTQGIPLVTAKTAQTLDGKIATAAGHSQWITDEETRSYTRRRRDMFDAILVGINTVLKDNPALNPACKTKPWTKIILDGRLRIPLSAKVFQDFHTVVATTVKAPVSKIKQLENKGVKVLVCPADTQGRIRWNPLLAALGKMQVTNLLIEGGAQVVGSALKDKVVDRMLTVIAPKILGDQRALSSIDGLNIGNVNRAVRLDVDQVCQIGPDWVFEGGIKY